MVWLPTARAARAGLELGTVSVATPATSATVPLASATPLSLKVTLPVGTRVATGPPAVLGLTVTWNVSAWLKVDGLVLLGATRLTAEVVLPSWLTVNEGDVVAELPTKLFVSELT